ncbi:MAG: 4Fe-4S binding protein [Candidatus Eremiobacteraeota bacterium]|nr:4Fe-4S binding protein [Candidatus Eremiobacteraeota bacterium]
MKTQGKIDLVGISTHYIRAVRAAADHPDIDCIFAILNRRGLGIMDGDAQEMESALSQAHDKGKIIFIMKAIGGGHLFREAEESLAYVSALPFVDSVIVGMQSVEEIECNIEIMENGERMSEDGSIFSPQRPQRPQRVLDDIRVSKNLKNSIFPFSHYPFPFSLFPLPIHPRGHKRIKEKRNWIKDPLSLFHLPYSYFPLPSGGIPVFSIAILRELCDLCGEKPPCSINGSRKSEDVSRFLHKERKLLIEDYCRGCGECEKACPFGAIRVIEGKARVDYDKCMLCSYCAYKCPDFCIKVI